MSKHLNFLLLVFFVLSNPLYGQDCPNNQSTRTYTLPGTYHCSFTVSGTTNLTVTVYGAGGAGGSGTGAQGGGGGGAAASGEYALFPNTTYTMTFTVGAGGVPGGIDNGNGGNSTFDATFLGTSDLFAGGGQGANGATGGSGGAIQNGIGNRGGNGANASGANGGGGGGSASAVTPGNNATGATPGTGGASGGAGGFGSQAGSFGAAPGGGGGGKGSLSTGSSGQGGNGRVVLTLALAQFRSPLPIELTTFAAIEYNGRVMLEWETATEENNEFMAIEHSLDGRNFREIGRVIGAGSTQETRHYSFTDAAPAYGINYYRLRQVDFDGSMEYSPIVTATVRQGSSAAALTLYPNPAPYELTVPGISGRAVVYNSIGQALLQTTLSPDHATIDVSQLPSGHYWLEVRGDRGELRSSRFSK